MSEASWPIPGDRAFYIGDWDAEDPPKADGSDLGIQGVVVSGDIPGRIGCVFLDGGFNEGPEKFPRVTVHPLEPNSWFPTRRAALLAAADVEEECARKTMALAARLREIAAVPE